MRDVGFVRCRDAQVSVLREVIFDHLAGGFHDITGDHVNFPILEERHDRRDPACMFRRLGGEPRDVRGPPARAKLAFDVVVKLDTKAECLLGK